MFCSVNYYRYLCSVPSSQEVYDCNLFNRGGPSRLQPAINLTFRLSIFFYKDPMLSEGNERDTLVPLKYNVYLCGMITILYLISPLIIWSVAKVLSEMYNRVETFLFDED